MKNKGLFISIEGIDGSGKTTLLTNLISKLNESKSVLSIREPGGTRVSEQIRDILLNQDNIDILPRTEAFLYATARIQLLEEKVKPALAEGKLVLADRYIDSTIAYQGYGRGIDIEFLKDLNHLCTGGIIPDLTILLDIDPLVAARRRSNSPADRLEMEGIHFLNRVRKGYLEIAAQQSRIKVLDASGRVEDIVKKCLVYIEEKAGKASF